MRALGRSEAGEAFIVRELKARRVGCAGSWELAGGGSVGGCGAIVVSDAWDWVEVGERGE
jgi:hypothetical protein